MKRYKSGHSVIELMTAISIFVIFMLALFTVISFGFKNYRLIDMKSETRGQALVALGRISSELISTDLNSLVLGTQEEEYMVFETAINPTTNNLEKDDTKLPLWQGYILYYTYPRDPSSTDKKLIRKFIPHSPNTLAKKMTSIIHTNMDFYLTDTCSTGENIKFIAQGVKKIDFSINSTNSYIIDISIVVQKNFLKRRLAYDKDFSDNTGQESITLKSSVIPRNTQD